MGSQIEQLMETIKSKVRALNPRRSKRGKPYIKIDKSASVKVELRSRKTRQLIDKTLKVADRPGKRSFF